MTHEIINDVGLLLFAVGTIWLLVLIFKESIAQGIITLWLLPLVYMILKTNWKASRVPFGLHLLGAVFLIYGNIVDPTYNSKTGYLSSLDGSVSINIPKSWSKLSSLDKDSLLQAGDPKKNKYIVIYSGTIEEFGGSSANDLVAIYTDNMKEMLEDVQVGNINTIQINGMNAMQRVVHGDENNIRVSYIYNVIDIKSEYYIILAWTLESTYHESKDELMKVIHSFKHKNNLVVSSNDNYQSEVVMVN